jgi:sugar lactone lactonase YvrE
LRSLSVTDVITTIAGNGTAAYGGDGGPATSARLRFPRGVAVDASGNIYIADTENHRIRKVINPGSSGIISTVAGNGQRGYSSDGVLATSAQLNYPIGIAVDALGNIYIADAENNRIRKVTNPGSSGIISTVAGNGESGYSSDGVLATSARLNSPFGVAVDASGNVYIADAQNHRIRKVTNPGSSGMISTVAGNGESGYSSDGVLATSAQLNFPRGIVVDALGNIYIADTRNSRIRKVTNPGSSGIISTVAGNGESGYSGDGELAILAQIGYPICVAVDGSGNIYFADALNNRIRKVTNPGSSGMISTVAGDGTASFSEDGVLAISAQLGAPPGLCLDALGNIYITDSFNHRVRKFGQAPPTSSPSASPTTLSPTASPTVFSDIITTIAGDGTPGWVGDRRLATLAQLKSPYGVAVDASGNIYIADTGNNRIRKVTKSTGIITTVAGDGVMRYSGDGGPATSARLNQPFGVAVDASGNIYIADGGNHRIRKVTNFGSSGTISTVAGNGEYGYSGDGGLATSAQLYAPTGVAVDASGNIYIADTENHRIRKVTNPGSSGIISTVAGNGERGYSSDGVLATSAQLNYPYGVAVDALGNIYIADGENHRIRKVTNPGSSGIISTVAGNGESGYSSDGVLATSAQLNSPFGVAVDASGNVYIADIYNNRIRMVTNPGSSGIISTVAGDGTGGFSGDGELSTSGRLNNPYGLCLDALGDIYIADTYNNRVRKVGQAPPTSPPSASPTTLSPTASPTVSPTASPTASPSASPTVLGADLIATIAGDGTQAYGGDGGPATSARLDTPYGVAVDTSGNIYIADYVNHRIRKVTKSSGIISTVAGNGESFFSGDGELATSARLNQPFGVAVDASGNVYIVDYANVRIRKVTNPGSLGIISTVAGNGEYGYTGDGVLATSARLDNPTGVAVDASGNIYIADSQNHRIRKVTKSDGMISTVAGNGGNGYSGNGVLATSAQLSYPYGVAVDALGNIYIVDSGSQRVQKVTPGSSGIISTVAGNGESGYSGDGEIATSARLNQPFGIAVDASGNIYIADTHNNRIRLVTKSTGIISTVAGDGTLDFSGDQGLAISAQLGLPFGLCLDALGNIYIADTYNQRVRIVGGKPTPSASPTSSPSSLPTASPSSSPTSSPSSLPTSSPSSSPTASPSSSPTSSPSSSPTSSPSSLPTSSPSKSASPTSSPSSSPTSLPSSSPSSLPTSSPSKSASPTSSPSSSPTSSKSASPTALPSSSPTSSPSSLPTSSPSSPSSSPTSSPSSSSSPTSLPSKSASPTSSPSKSPSLTSSPSSSPTASPSSSPTASLSPSSLPTASPSSSSSPTSSPSSLPTASPSSSPSPTSSPSPSPTSSPSSSPTASLSPSPTASSLPSASPTVLSVFPAPSFKTESPISPTSRPTKMPVTAKPTKMPVTEKPTKMPVTPKPTKMPVTAKPTKMPVTAKPTKMPATAKPTKMPVMCETNYPTGRQQPSL